MIRVVTDSTCDLPPEVIQKFNIEVAPLYINIGERGFLDGEEISRSEFYTNLPNYPHHPTTGTPSPERLRGVYQSLIRGGASQVLSIHISERLSATVNVARSAAAEFPPDQVVVLDSDQLSYGTGFQVETAAQMASEGEGMEEILGVLKEQASRTLVAAVLDTLEYLRRSGRMNRIMQGIGSLIKLKPILVMENGVPGSEKVRTKEGAMNRLVEMVSKYQPIERFVLLHTNSPVEAEALSKRINKIVPLTNVASVNITPVIGAHLGPGAVGFAVMSASTTII